MVEYVERAILQTDIVAPYEYAIADNSKLKKGLKRTTIYHQTHEILATAKIYLCLQLSTIGYFFIRFHYFTSTNPCKIYIYNVMIHVIA